MELLFSLLRHRINKIILTQTTGSGDIFCSEQPNKQINLSNLILNHGAMMSPDWGILLLKPRLRLATAIFSPAAACLQTWFPTRQCVRNVDQKMSTSSVKFLPTAAVYTTAAFLG